MSTMNKVKSVSILIAAGLARAIGLEVGNIGGQALANDIRFIIGKEPHPVYKTGKILPKYVDVNPYNGKKTQVKWDKKQQKFVPTKRQPKNW